MCVELSLVIYIRDMSSCSGLFSRTENRRIQEKWSRVYDRFSKSFECSLCNNLCNVNIGAVVGEHDEEDDPLTRSCEHWFCFDCLYRMEWSYISRVHNGVWICIECPWCRSDFFTPVCKRTPMQVMHRVVQLQAKQLEKYDMIEEIISGSPVVVVEEINNA